MPIPFLWLILVSFLTFFKCELQSEGRGGASTRLMLPSFNLEYMHKSWSYLTTKLWNSLPTRVGECPDLAAFRPVLLSFMARRQLCPIVTDLGGGGLLGGWPRHIGVLFL